MNPLADNPGLRKKVYQLFWAVGLVLGGLSAFFGASNHGAPDWLNPATATYAFLGVGVGYQAAQNTPKPESGLEGAPEATS